MGEFVKNGCREATIEIELAGGNLHRRNPVIRRIIKHEGNKSTFTINGNPSTKNEVLTLARKFSIQIDNLCQFLPQDKVSEFAALSPVELLHSTQRAAAGPEMIEWHENLKSLRAGQKRLQLANGGDKETLTNLESRQEMQRADVERMKQRAEVKKRIQLLEKVRPIPQYREAHKEALEAREKKVKLQKELDDLKNKTEPAVRATNAKKDYLSQIEDVVRYRRRLVHEADSKAQNTAHEMESTDRAVQDLNNQIDAERRSGRKQLDTIKQLQQRINRLKRQAEEEPVEFDGAFYTEQIVCTIFFLFFTLRAFLIRHHSGKKSGHSASWKLKQPNYKRIKRNLPVNIEIRRIGSKTRRNDSQTWTRKLGNKRPY